MTRFSVLMPVLNEESSISGALDSVLAQAGDLADRGLQLEVVVADGCSADATAAVVAARAAVDRRIVLVENPAVTIPAGLNAALRAASGDYAARVDGHSEIADHYFARAVDWLADEPNLAGVGGQRVGVATTPVGRAVALVLSSRFGVGDSINHYAQNRQHTDHASFGVYRRTAVDEVGGWDENLLVNEDVDFDHRLLQRGYELGYDPSMVLRWHVRESVWSLFAQYRRYGRGKAAMVRKNGPAAIRARHLAPPAAVVLTGALTLASFRRPFLLAGVLPYAALVGAASVIAYRNRDTSAELSASALPRAFVAVHAAWGLGFLEGLVLGKRPALASGRSDVRQGDATAGG